MLEGLRKGIRAVGEYFERNTPGGAAHQTFDRFVGGRISLKEAYRQVDALEKRSGVKKGSLRLRFDDDTRNYALTERPSTPRREPLLY